MTNAQIRQRLDEMNRKAAQPATSRSATPDADQRRLVFARNKETEADAALQQSDDALAYMQMARAQIMDVDNQIASVEPDYNLATQAVKAILDDYDARMAAANQVRPRARDAAISDVEFAMQNDRNLAQAQQTYTKIQATMQALVDRRSRLVDSFNRAEQVYNLSLRKRQEAVNAASIAKNSIGSSQKAALEIDRGDSFHYQPTAGGGWIRIKQPGSRVIVMASVNSSPPVPFIVDTGAPDSFILRSSTVGWWRGQPTLVSFPLAEGKVSGIDSSMEVLQLGPYQIKDVPVTVVDLPDLAQEGVAGLIGDNVLSKFRVTIDYDNRVLTLEPR